MSNNIFSLDPTTHQSSLSKVNIGSTDDSSLIVLGKVTKVYYHQGTLDFKLTSGVSSIVSDGSGNGTGSARIPLDYFGQDGEGRTYGHYRPVQIGDTVAIAYLNGHKTSPIVIGVYAPNGEQYEAISPTLFDSGDDKDEYIAETGLAEQHVHHSGQISYRSGSGRLFESLNGYSYMVIDDDTSQDYSQLYVDLSLVPYSTIDGETREPQQEKAGEWLLVHEDNPNGLNADNHITRFYVSKTGDFELVFTNTSFAGVSTVLHMDKNGMKLNKYIGHQSKKAGLARANDEDRTITADFDSAPTTVTFDLGETNEDRISLKSSSTVDSKEQATNLEVRTDGVYINDTKLFDSESNSLAALDMFLDGGVMDFSKIIVKNFSGENIEDGTIEGSKLKDKTVNADKLNISKLSDISSDMGILTAGSIQLNNGTQGSTGVSVVGDPSSDPDILTASDKAHLQQQLNALYSQCQALIDYGNSVGIDISELKTNEQSLKNLTDWIFETDGNVTVDRPKIDDAITNFTALLETYRNKFTSQLNQKVAETSDKANSIYQGSQEPNQANVKEGDLWLQTNSDGTSNIMQYTNGVWQEANLKGYQDAITAAEKAQDAADKLPHNYYQATEPSGTQYNDGDLWYQNVSSTSNGKTKYNVYKWDISSKKWVQIIDNNANANYVASSAPADPSDGDFWTDTDGTLKQYQNGEWKTIPTQGPQGVPGVSATQQYIHIAYATSANGAENFSTTTFSGATYIGLLVDENEVDSTDYTKYTWSLMKGADGTDGVDGVPGKPGADGETSYVHFAYANSADGKTNFNLTYFDNALYVGVYTDFTESDSSDYTKYTWSRLRGADGQDGTDGKDGVPGANGVDGKTSYIHTAYANSADGKTNFNLTYFMNALYIGIYTDFIEADSNDSTKYTWSRLKGQDGTDGKDGVPGAKGADGQTSYVHFAYANSVDGKTGFSLTYFANALYVGIYTDFIEADSNDPTKYTWSRLKGDTGDTGNGIDSTVVTYQASSSGTTVPSGTWSTSIPKATPGQYVWTKTVIGYTDGTSATSYSVGKIGETGADGSDGADGKDGVGISSTLVTYQLSASGTTTPTGAWSSTVLSPTTANPYLWVRTVFTYSDGSTKTLYTISVKGDTGEDGVAGKDGVGLSSTNVTYQASNSGTTEPTGTWSSSVPTLTKGQYLWTKTVWSYTDGTTETGYSVAYVGKDGNDGNDGVAGKDGVGISNTTITYQSSTSGTTAPTGTWSSSIPTVSAGQYLWTKTVWTYTDGTNETGYSVAKMGSTGATGAAGVGVSSTVVTYQVSSSGTNTPTGTWSSTVPTVSAGQYLWTKTVWNYTNYTTSTGYSVSYVGSDGVDGKDGKDGVGVSSSTVAYQLSSSGTTTPTGVWSSSILAQTTTLPYLWTKTLITYTDGTTTTMYSVSAKGAKGDPGSDGAPGPKGADGISTYVWIKYATSDSGDNMSDSPVGMSYLGLATGKTSSNESSIPTDYKWTKIKGDQGVPGTPGVDGKTPYVHIAYANSADGKTDFTTKGTDASQATLKNSPYQYTGTYVDYNQNSSTDPTAYTWTLIYDKSKKRNFTTTPTTPYSVGDTWTQSGATYFCTTERLTGSFTASDWQMQQLNIHSLDDDLQANINGTKNLLMVDDIIYYSSPALDSTNTYNEGYQFDYTSTDTTYVFQVQAKSTISGDYVHMYPALGSAYSQSENKTSQVSVTTSPSVSNQTSTFNSPDSNITLALTTNWVTYTCVISGTWDNESILTALLGRVYNSETKGTVSFRNIKLVAGNAITDYTSDDSITVAQGSNYWDLTTLQNNSGVGTNLLQGTSTTTNQGPLDFSGIPVKVGNSYTLSGFMSSPSTSGVIAPYIQFYDGSGNLLKQFYKNTNVPVASGTSFVLTGVAPTNAVTARALLAKSAPSVTINYSSLKFEQGSQATIWSPNPSDSGYASWLQNRYYTPWYPISEGQRVFLTHYDYPAYPGIPNSASVEFADSNHNFISNGTNNSHGSSSLNGSNSAFMNPQSLGGVYYNERMLNISIASEAYTSGTYQDLYIQTSGLLQSKLAVSGRGTTVATFDPYSGQRVDTQYWDTYATVDNTNALINYLNSIANQDLVVAIATRDSFIQDSNDFQIASQNLCTVLQSMGLPSSYAPADLRGRVSFAFVGHTTAYQGTTDNALVNSSKGSAQVSTLTAYVSNGHISNTNTTRLVAYANAPANTTYFRAGYSFSTDEINRVHFMVTVDKLSTNYSSNIADVSSNAVRKDVSYRGVTLNDNGLTATAGNTQVIVNSSNGFEIKKSGVDVFSVDTNGNLTITGSTISTGNISGVNFQGQNLTLQGMLTVQGSIVGANKTFTIDQNGMKVSTPNGSSITFSNGGLTIQGTSVGSQSTSGTYGSNDSLAGDAGLFATKDKAGNTKTWITSSGTLIAQDAVIHGNVSVDNLTLTGTGSKIMFGSGFQIDGNGIMTATNSVITDGMSIAGTIVGSELDIGTDYHSKLSDADKFRYHVSSIGETTFGMSQDLSLMNPIAGVNASYLSYNNSWTTGQVNFNGTGSAPNNAMRSLGVTSDIYTDSYGWNHRFSAPVDGVSSTGNQIPLWDKDRSANSIPNYKIGYTITDSITNALNQQIPSPGWGGSDTLNWTLSTVEFPRLGASLFSFDTNSDLYPTLNQTITLQAGVTYVFGAYIWHCGLHGGAKLTVKTSTSDSSNQNTVWTNGNVVNYQQSGYSICTYTPSSNVYVRKIYIEPGTVGSTQGYDYGVPLSVTDPFAVPLNQFTSKLIGGGLDNLTSLGGHFGMPYPHLDTSQYGVLGLMRADNLNDGDKVIVSIPINYDSITNASFAQINLGVAKPGNDSIYTAIDGEFQPLMPGYYTYDFYFVWKDEYKQYINNNLLQLNLISKGISSGEKAYVVSVDSVRMGIFVGQMTTSSTQNVNEYQTKFSPLGSIQLSHISNPGNPMDFRIAGQTQLTSEGLEINSSYSFFDSYRGGMHISINGKSGIGISGEMNNGNPDTQPTLSFYGSVPYSTLLEHTIEPQYNVNWDEPHAASGIWFDSYGNAHGYGSSLYWHVQSPSKKSNFAVPLADGNEYGFALSDSNGNSGSNILRIGLVHFNKFGGGYVSGNYPALISGSGNTLSGIAFADGYVIIFGNRNTTNNFWSFPQGTSDGHSSDSGTVSEVTSQNNM